jgi:GDP-D-mannose 3',5'-epimerase
MTGDLRDPYFVRHVIDRRFDEVYRLAADMAGTSSPVRAMRDFDAMTPMFQAG